MVSGAVGSRPHCVPHSTTLWSLAASISIAALRMPEVIRSFRLGRPANIVRGNGVRSRIAQMISKSFSALAAVSAFANGWLNTVTSTRSETLDQSATESATLR